MSHVVLITNTGWSMVRHRREQIRGLIERGWRVSAIAAFNDKEEHEIRTLGAEPYRLSCEGSGVNVIENLVYLAKLAALLRRLDPDVVHAFSLKASIWGSMAANLTSIQNVACTITGAGMLLAPGYSPWMRKMVRGLSRVALAGRMTRVVFQNTDDLEFFVSAGLVDRARCRYIPGCGVDIAELKPNFRRNGKKRFVMVSRLMWSKGVRPFVEAAQIVKRKRPDAEFLLVGGSQDDYPSKNPDFVPAAWLNRASSNGEVTWIGRVPPIRAEQIMRDATAVVLLSRYAEGVPRTLIEAAALGAPIITTDAPGCRDVVQDGVSGFLCNGSAPQQAADAMLELLDNPQLVSEMGMAGRAIAQKFDKERVLEDTLRIYGRK